MSEQNEPQRIVTSGSIEITVENGVTYVRFHGGYIMGVFEGQTLVIEQQERTVETRTETPPPE